MTQANEPFKHDGFLGRLDWTQRGILPDGRYYEHYYPKEEFEKAIPNVDGINLIYAARHPEKVNGENLEDVLKKVDGKYAGYLDSSMVYNMGNPKLKTVFNIVDSEVEEKIRSGDISVSFAFGHDPVPAKGSLSGIVPDHVLLYDRSLGVPQGDPSAMIYNTDTQTIHYTQGYFEGDNTMADPEPVVKAIDMELYSGLLDFKKNQETIVENEKTMMKLNQEITDLSGVITGLKTEIESEKTTSTKLNQDLADLTAKYNQDLEISTKKIEELETKIETERLESFKANQDLRWNRLPKGVKDKFESRKAEFFEEKTSMKLNQDIIDFVSMGPDTNNLKGAEGDSTQTQNQNTGKVPVTKFDPTTGKMVQVE